MLIPYSLYFVNIEYSLYLSQYAFSFGVYIYIYIYIEISNTATACYKGFACYNSRDEITLLSRLEFNKPSLVWRDIKTETTPNVQSILFYCKISIDVYRQIPRHLLQVTAI